MTVSSRLRGGAAVGALALLAGLAAPTPAFAAEVLDDPVTLDRGHVDTFFLNLDEDNNPQLMLKEDVTGNGVLRSPENVNLQVKSDAYAINLTSADAPADAPQDLYYLPLTPLDDPDLLWPGWDSMNLQSHFGSNATVDINVDVQAAPDGGEAYLWTTGRGGTPVQRLNEGWKLPGTIHQSSLNHEHINWGFTQPGTYTLSAQADVASADGSKTGTTNSATYTFTVVPAPQSLSISGADGEFESGEQVTLSAVQAPEGANFGSFAWETRASDDAEWQLLDGETAAALTVAAADGAQYRATVSGGRDFGVDGFDLPPIQVVSEPVTIQASGDETPATTISIEGLADAYEVGDTASLNAVQDPETGEDHWHWFIQRAGDEEFSVISGASTDALEYEVAEGDHDAKIKAVLYDHDHAVVAESDPVALNVPSEAPAPEYDLTISGLAHHYHQGNPITLTANAEPAVEGGSFRWYVQRVDQDEPVRVDGAAGAQLQMIAEQALNNAEVTAELLDADGNVLAADAVTVEVDDHGAPAHQQVTVGGLSDHYHSGDTATLTASVDPESVLTRFEWLVQLPGEDEWTTVEGENSAEYAFEVSDEFDGARVMARLTYDNGEEYVSSEPVTIHVENHGEEPEPQTSITIEGLADEYQIGDVASLNAVQDPETGEDHWHWFIQRAGDEEFSVISGASTDALEYEVAEGDHDAKIKAVLYDHDHAVVAESDPVSLNVAEDSEPAPQTSITIEGLADEYQIGDVASLNAVQDPETGEDHWHWFIQRSGDDEFSVLNGALSDALEYEIVDGDDGAQIKAVLYDHDHAVVAESDAVTLNVGDDPGQGPGDEGENGNGNGAGGGAGGLASTGGELTGYVLGGALLLVAGAGTVLAARKRSLRGTAE
ncbi:choice-of-anchor M domain-containing protein [Leucobacter sp. CSA1]|uniref:Choice-of-anchor M domain-containing protein n=1 Tax=Leucobacter chromiisoli TaxID=2796471 RepID=A0A934UUS3_9MICO|nr:choice-of-anchor M domain-containing protein [Leucobacter chromiisoli]MBK0419120.1 choice-of-anchor M domain-containing protein [Leucobacter chromiisoli]